VSVVYITATNELPDSASRALVRLLFDHRNHRPLSRIALVSVMGWLTFFSVLLRKNRESDCPVIVGISRL
jgi:hypothetical protein